MVGRASLANSGVGRVRFCRWKVHYPPTTGSVQFETRAPLRELNGMKKTTNKKTKTKARPGRSKAETRVIPTYKMYYIFSEIKNVGTDAPNYKTFYSTIDLWIKARTETLALALAKRWMADAEWEFKSRFLITEVERGFARFGSLIDPLAFSDEEADEWEEHYDVANTDGIDYAFSHF
jgi:hypothetical protein